MLGTYGMVANVYPGQPNTTTPTDRYRDAADRRPVPVHHRRAHVHRPDDLHLGKAVVQRELSDHAGDRLAATAQDRPRRTRPTRCARSSSRASYYYERKYGATLGVLPDDGQCGRRSLGSDADGNAQYAEQQRLHRRARLASDPERAAAAAVHGIQEVQRRPNELRRHRAQRERQQHAVLRCLGGVLSRTATCDDALRAVGNHRRARKADGSKAMRILSASHSWDGVGAASRQRGPERSAGAAELEAGRREGGQPLLDLPWSAGCQRFAGISHPGRAAAKTISLRSSRISRLRRVRKRRRTISCGGSRAISTTR